MTEHDRRAERDERAGADDAADTVGPASLRVSRDVQIPIDELSWRFTGSGGPGGQHANTSNTRVELVFDIGRSPSLSRWSRARLLDQIGPSIRVVAADTRSQARNRELALERLQRRLAAALREQRVRRPTAPTRSSQRTRVEHKRVHGKKKEQRRRPTVDE
ncbi:MAG TPA: alternative ribosome rescue aminoacyl-tRNA hydrolase ArfB [Acidimicrobiia bacterium]|jgi:ribosome-associated protein